MIIKTIISEKKSCSRSKFIFINCNKIFSRIQCNSNYTRALPTIIPIDSKIKLLSALPLY